MPLDDDDIFVWFRHYLLRVHRKEAYDCLGFLEQNRRYGMKCQRKFSDHDLEVLYPRSILEIRQLHVEASEKFLSGWRS